MPDENIVSMFFRYKETIKTNAQKKMHEFKLSSTLCDKIMRVFLVGNSDLFEDDMSSIGYFYKHVHIQHRSYPKQWKHHVICITGKTNKWDVSSLYL